MNTIAEAIARRRKELGMTQKELAEKLNVSDKTLSRWETGKQIPDALTLLDIAKALDLTISEIYGAEETEKMPQPQQPAAQKRIPVKNLLKFTGAGIAAILTIALLAICFGNHCLKSKVTYSAKEIPMYALTYYDYSVLDWINRCNEGGKEVNCLSSLGRDAETGKDIVHYLFYLPHGYADTEVKVRYQLGFKGNVLKLDFKNTTQSMDDKYYLCYVKVDWDEEGFGLETTLDGSNIRLQGQGFARYFVELCSILFPDE